MGTEYTDESGYPLESLTENACGPPEGGGPHTGGDCLTCPIGINGWAIWQFDPDYVIVNGTGEDFMTFTKTWAWDSAEDGLCCELAFVQVSSDGFTWYEVDPDPVKDLLRYDTNPNPTESSDNYVYANVAHLHGNAPTNANFRKDMSAEAIQTIDGEKHLGRSGRGNRQYVLHT